jgi:phosphoesterase RecJ-like protein
MEIHWPRFRDLVDRHDRIVLTSHVRPDADALGSELGLAGALKQRGKEVRIVNASRTPPRLRELDSEGQILQLGDQVALADLQGTELIVVLDTSAWAQLGEMADFIRNAPAARAVIDHHVGEDDLGAELFKDREAEATGMLVFQLIPYLDAELTPEIAHSLFSAIATDTGWFRFSSTRGRTFRVAGDLIDAGAMPSRLYRQLYEHDSLARVRLMGIALERMQVARRGKVAYTSIRRSDFERTGALPPDSEEVVNYTMTLSGVEVGLLFIEQPHGGIKVSFRSRTEFDCNALAQTFGGGGHRQAAGATLPEPIEDAERRILQALETIMET